MYACKYLHKYRCYLQFIHIGIVPRSIFGNIQCTVGSVRYEMSFGNHQRCSCSMPLLHFEGSFSPKSTIWSNYSDLTPPHTKWWFRKGSPLISGKPRLVKYDNLASNLATTVVFVSPDVSLPVTLIPQRHFVPFSQESCYLGKSDRYRPVTWHQKTCSSGSKEVIYNHLGIFG